MMPEGITECRVCGRPVRGLGGGICEDCRDDGFGDDPPTAPDAAGVAKKLREIAGEIEGTRWRRHRRVIAADIRALAASLADGGGSEGSWAGNPETPPETCAFCGRHESQHDPNCFVLAGEGRADEDSTKGSDDQ